jgi:tellurite methyltransferase
VEYAHLFSEKSIPGPVLDLACGDGHNGVFLASRNLKVICCDISRDALNRAARLAAECDVRIEALQVDLERERGNLFRHEDYGAIIVFRYLHRPLIPCLKKALNTGGLMIYETFTVGQTRYGKPSNPDFLLRPGELREWFADWEIIHTFEGIKDNPKRAVAQLVCRKLG